MSYLFRFIRAFVIALVLLYVYHHWFSVDKTEGLLTLSVPAGATEETFRLHNVSNEPLWLDIADHSVGAQAGYASALAPNHYSVFSLAKGPLTFVCYQGALGVTDHKANCGRVLKIDKVLSPHAATNTGNYWVLENIDESVHK